MKKCFALFVLLICFCFSINAQNACVSSTGSNIAIRDITFQSTWNATEHSSVPTNAHWSDLVGIVHAYPNQFLEFGQNATPGIKNVAEIGDNTVFLNEVQTAVNAGTAHIISIDPFNPNNATSSITFEASSCDTTHYLTLVSMVAPSPDWFIAVNSLDLSNTTQFPFDQTITTVDVFAYDAGTDNGINYDSPNSPNTPVGISLITGFPLNGNKIGTLTVEFKSLLLDTPKFTTIDAIKIFPNPTKGKITISKNTALKTVEIYNILGALVKTIATEGNTKDIIINLSKLNKGLYIIKLNDENGNTKTQKLVLE